jgi:fructose 1,6-bisphosphatase
MHRRARAHAKGEVLEAGAMPRIVPRFLRGIKKGTIRSKAKLLLHGMKSLCYGDPSAFNIEAFGHQEEHRGLSLACGDSIQTD